MGKSSNARQIAMIETLNAGNPAPDDVPNERDGSLFLPGKFEI
jgi:hypothetical protein